MKKGIIYVALAALMALTLASCKSPEEISQAAQQQPTQKTTQEIVIKQEVQQDERTLSVSGKGTVQATPDVATIQLSVYAQAAAAEAAQNDNSAKMDAVIKAVKALGVDEKDIQTSQISLNPLMGNPKSPQEVTGYEATNTVTVKLRQVDKAGQLVTDATAAGANRVLGMTFDLEDQTESYRKALAMAVADAAEKAKVMAEAAGAQLDGPLSVQENGSTVVPMSENVMRAAAADVKTTVTPVQSGQIIVTADVTVQYKLKVAGEPTATPKP